MVKDSRKKAEIVGEDTKGMSDWLKKNLIERLNTILMDEEGIRHDLLDLKLPKNVLSAALAQALRTKKDLSNLVAKEIRLFLEGIELSELIKKVIAGQGIEITARIKFIADEQKKTKKSRSKAIKR